MILHSGGYQIYYNIKRGGGVSRDPKFVLCNIWTAPYSGNARKKTFFFKLRPSLIDSHRFTADFVCLKVVEPEPEETFSGKEISFKVKKTMMGRIGED